MNKLVYLIAILTVSLSTAGCMNRRSNEENAMRPLASALTKLSSEMESLVRYGNPPANATENDLFLQATKNDPSCLDPFDNYTLHTRTQDNHAIVLLCTGDEKQGLLEDLGCTAMLDRNLWGEGATMPCDFSLSVELVCNRK